MDIHASSAALNTGAAAQFDTISESYDTMRFLRIIAHRLVELAHLTTGQTVMDVATGTGEAAIAAARAVGPAGSVTAIDISAGMLARAREKAVAAGLDNVVTRQENAERTGLSDASLNAIVCSSALFLLPDIPAVIAEWRRIVQPGGIVAFSTFAPQFLQPLYDLWQRRLEQHGIASRKLPFHRLNTIDQCRALLTQAGFTEVDVHLEQLGYYLPTPAERWADIGAGMEGFPLRQLDRKLVDRIQAEHMAELAAFVDSKGIYVDVPAIFATGR